MHRSLFPLVITLFSLCCADHGLSPEERRFNISLRYGVLGRNELNTFQNTFTKDLILDGTMTVPLVLSPDELARIETRLLEIDFFSYPDTFVIATTDSLVGIVSPHPTFLFKVKRHSELKTVFWEDAIVTSSAEAAKLRETTGFIQSIIEAKQEYQQLPPPRGGYL